MATPDTQTVDPEFPTLVKPTPEDRNKFEQPVRVGDHERMLAKQEGDKDKFAEKPRQTHMGTAAEHKAFLDENNIRTEEQAEKEQPARRGDTPGGSDLDHNQTAPSKGKPGNQTQGKR